MRLHSRDPRNVPMRGYELHDVVVARHRIAAISETSMSPSATKDRHRLYSCEKWAAGICICGAGILQCGAGTRLPQENGALEFLGAALECCCAALELFLPQKMQRWNPSVFRWNPDSRKIMGRWNPPVFRWSLIPAKKWGAGISPRLGL